MPDIHFTCPACGKHLVIDAEGAGLQIACPQCGGTITIPPAAEPAAPADPAPALGSVKHPLAPPTGPGLSGGLHFRKKTEDENAESHAEDVNVDQPFSKKHDQWFTTNHGKKYHYCYYNPHGRLMKTACGIKDIEVTAEIAGTDLQRIRKGAFCHACLKALDLDVDELS